MDQSIWGDVPTWITAGAVVLAALQYLSDRNKRQAEANREAKAQASQLGAWVVTDPSLSPRTCGVVISNTSSSTFHNVELDVKIFDAPTFAPLKLDLLPPGRFYVQYTPSEKFPWKFATDCSEYDGELRPYMNSDGYLVQQIRFADNLNQKWSTDAHSVLQRA